MNWPETSAAWRRLKSVSRAYLAQVFLGWALKMDANEVVMTVCQGVNDAAIANKEPQP